MQLLLQVTYAHDVEAVLDTDRGSSLSLFSSISCPEILINCRFCWPTVTLGPHRSQGVSLMKTLSVACTIM